MRGVGAFLSDPKSSQIPTVVYYGLVKFNKFRSLETQCNSGEFYHPRTSNNDLGHGRGLVIYVPIKLSFNASRT